MEDESRKVKCGHSDAHKKNAKRPQTKAKEGPM